MKVFYPTGIALGFILSTGINQGSEAAPQASHLSPIILAYWWEIPAQPPEKLISPRREDDEWYKRRHKQKYRKVR